MTAPNAKITMTTAATSASSTSSSTSFSAPSASSASFAQAPHRDRRTRPSRRDRYATLRLLGTLAMSLAALVYLMPFVIQVVTTFKTDPQAAASPLSLLPNPFSVATYRQLFGGGSESVPFPTWLDNSVVVALVVTAGHVFFDALAGYALARLTFRGRGLLTVLLISVMAVPGVVLMIPNAQAHRRAPGHHPGCHRLLRLPASLRAGRERGGAQGVSTPVRRHARLRRTGP